MESRRSSNRNTAPGLREIDLATVRAQYVLEHKTGAVGGDHMAETQFQVRHMKISKPRPLPISKSARSPRPRSHSKLQKARSPPPPLPSSSRQDEPAPLLAPLIFDDAPDPEPMFSTSAHLPPHPDPHQSDESLTCFRDRRAGIVLQLGTPSALSETSPGDLARSLFEARIARRKSYLGHPDYYIPRSVKTRASVVSQAPSTARLNAMDSPTGIVPPLPGLRAYASTSTLSPMDTAADEGDVATQSHPVATNASAPTKRPRSDVAKKLFSLSRSSSLPNPIARAPRRVLVEEVTDEGTPPDPYASLPMTSTPQRTREASTAPSDGVVEGFYSLRISNSPNATPSSSPISTSPRSTHADLVDDDELPAPVFASLPESSTRWRASNGTSVRSRMSTVLEEEPSPLPASTHLPSVQSTSTVSLVHSVFTHDQPSGDGPDTSGTSLSAHARTPRKAAKNLPSTSIRDSQRHSDKPLPTLPAQGGVHPDGSEGRMYSLPAGGVTASRPWRPQVAGGRKLVRKHAQHALRLDTESDEDLRTFRLQLAARPPEEPAGWFRRDVDRPPLSVTSMGSLLGVRYRKDCHIDFGNLGQGGEGAPSPTIYEYIT